MKEYTTKEKSNKNQYFKEFFPPIVIYVVLIFTLNLVQDDLEGSVWVYPVALSPLVPIFFVFRAVIRFIQRSDEFIRKLHGESAVVTLVIVNFIGFAYGLLISVGIPAPDLFLAASLICPVYFLVYAYLSRKHGGGGCL
ncbi:hypothetical protein [Paremcibacter congregatus]|uniref:Uncharacterized protein n=1 Tax=Paremcibacter congregatus TaxID=2043170 RepID=A0A2G4YSH4_9PROT|nr:hypothetical protein [Paremcibacter congregatus]PHZ85291.1 hypothetical protein CRD36_07760 [Paremcibacter congregatus]QDE27777.1 hypothetical protein FIV45_11075 [Paremcibacter congregatus]|tara:strand:- start:525 stop:941 length:417 start_codon:yes stop_codon:yes gene_type:complete